MTKDTIYKGLRLNLPIDRVAYFAYMAAFLAVVTIIIVLVYARREPEFIFIVPIFVALGPLFVFVELPDFHLTAASWITWVFYFYISYRRLHNVGLKAWTLSFNLIPVVGFVYLFLIGYADSREYVMSIPKNIYAWWRRYLDYEPPMEDVSGDYERSGFVSSASPYFSFKRSSGRLEYWISTFVALSFFAIAASAGPVILALQIALLPLIMGRYYDLYGFFYYASVVIVAGPFLIAGVLIYVSAVIRRLRDVGWSRLFAIFIIVPLYNVALQIVLGVIPGRAKIREKIN